MELLELGTFPCVLLLKLQYCHTVRPKFSCNTGIFSWIAAQSLRTLLFVYFSMSLIRWHHREGTVSACLCVQINTSEQISHVISIPTTIFRHISLSKYRKTMQLNLRVNSEPRKTSCKVRVHAITIICAGSRNLFFIFLRGNKITFVISLGQKLLCRAGHGWDAIWFGSSSREYYIHKPTPAQAQAIVVLKLLSSALLVDIAGAILLLST